MELNKDGIEELRKFVEDQLQDVPYGQRIHLDKDLLEELLFETITCNKETGEKIRLPIWSGEFLRKIDLSEISFDNVAWSLITEPNFGSKYDYLFDKETEDRFYKQELYVLPDGQMIDYSHTNAQIDFSKSWEAKHGEIIIVRCNFSGVDLSNNDMSNLDFVQDSNLSNTGLKLPLSMSKKLHTFFYVTDLSGIDLSEFYINGEYLFNEEDDECFADYCCNLSNTGLNITLKIDENMDSDPEEVKDGFRKMLEAGFLDGCYVNGKKILSSDEKQNIKRKKKAEYEEMKAKIFLDVANSIQEQISGSGRK